MVLLSMKIPTTGYCLIRQLRADEVNMAVYCSCGYNHPFTSNNLCIQLIVEESTVMKFKSQKVLKFKDILIVCLSDSPQLQCPLIHS